MPKTILLGNLASNSTVGQKNKELGEFLSRYCPGTVYNSVVAVDDIVFWCGQSALPSNARNVTLIARDKLTVTELSVLSQIKCVIAQSPREAFIISQQLQHNNYKTMVISLPPWTRLTPVDRVNSVGYLSLSNECKVVGEWPMVNSITNGQLFCHLTPNQFRWPYEIFQAMVNGTPVLINPKQFGSDYIVDYHNGYLVDSGSSLNHAIRHYRKNQKKISDNTSDYVRALFEPTKYLRALLNPDSQYNYNIQAPKIEYKDRVWVVRRKILSNSGIDYFPNKIDPNYKTIELNGLHETIEHFVGKLFAEVYVFEDELPQWFKVNDINNLKLNLFQIGKKAKKIHFCTNQEIPDLWAPIFRNISVISVEEGLKQVSE